MSFVCFAASIAAAFVTVPLLEFLAALFLLFAYSNKFNERFKGFLWPLMVREFFKIWHFKNVPEKLSLSAGRSRYKVLMFLFFSLKDFMRCVTASIIFFIISIIAVSKYADGSSKAAGVRAGVLIFIRVYVSIIVRLPQFLFLFHCLLFHRYSGLLPPSFSL